MTLSLLDLPIAKAVLSRRCLFAAALLALAALPLSAGAPTSGSKDIRLSSNENAFGYSPKALAKLKEVLDSGNYYNHNESAELVKLCAAHEGVPEDFILPTPGSGPVLMMTAMAYAKPGVNVVTSAPGYPQLTGAFANHGGEIKYVPVKADYGQDFKAMLAAIDARTAIVYVCNPNNPTGVLADPDELRRFVFAVPKDVLVFVDEAYLELSDKGLPANTMSAFVKARKNLIVSRTFSKGYGMAGIRVGYGIANPEVLEKLKRFYMGPPSYLASIAGQEAIKDQAFLELNRKRYREVRDYVCKEFDKMGIPYASPQGAFIYFRTKFKGTELVAKLKQSGVLITRFPTPGVAEGAYDDWSRVSLGTKEDMDIFLGELAKALGKT